MNKLIKKVLLLFAILSILTLFVIAANTETVYNPHTGKLDYIRSGNFSGENLNLDNYNLTNVQCVVFVSGGTICNSP